MIECGINPPSLQKGIVSQKLVDGQCFNIISSGRFGKGSKLALTVDSKDKSDGWGIYDVMVAKWPGVGESEKNQ